MGDDLVYIAHAVSGNVQQNMDEIRDICRHLHTEDNNLIPFAPYIVTLQYLDDNVQEERELGIEANTEYFERQVMDAMYITGHSFLDSTGMKAEVDLAVEHDIPLTVYNPEELADDIVDDYNPGLEDEVEQYLREEGYDPDELLLD